MPVANKEWGLGVTTEPTAPTGAATIASAGSAVYTFAVPMAFVAVQNKSTSGVRLVVKINGTTCADTDKNTSELVAGQPLRIGGGVDKIMVKRVCIWCTGATATYGTHFTIFGWPG